MVPKCSTPCSPATSRQITRIEWTERHNSQLIKDMQLNIARIRIDRINLTNLKKCIINISYNEKLQLPSDTRRIYGILVSDDVEYSTFHYLIHSILQALGFLYIFVERTPAKYYGEIANRKTYDILHWYGHLRCTRSRAVGRVKYVAVSRQRWSRASQSRSVTLPPAFGGARVRQTYRRTRRYYQRET